MVDVVRARELNAGEPAEQFGVAAGNAGAQREDLVELFELADPDRSVNVIEPVVEAESRMLEPAAVIGAPLIAERAQQSPRLFGVRRDHPALAGGDLLVRIEGERRVDPVRTDRLALVLGAEGLARILDEHEAVLVGDRAQLVELARVAVDVDADDRLRARRHSCFDGRGVHVQRARVDVGKDGCPAFLDEAVRRRRERVRRRDHLVAGLDARDDAEQMQSGRAGRNRGGVRRTRACGKEFLEAVDRRPEREPAGAHHLEDELFLALVEVRPRERDRANFLLHACVFAAGAYSSQCAQRSPRPRTVSRYACCSSSVTGPGGPIT